MGGASTWVFEYVPHAHMWRPQEDIRHFLLSPPALFFFNIGSSTHSEAHHFPFKFLQLTKATPSAGTDDVGILQSV